MGKNVQRQAVLDALIAGATVKQAATAGQVSEKTVRRWLDNEEFSAQLAVAQKEVTKRISRTIISRAERAVCVLNEIMTDTENPPTARVSAANNILGHASKAIETAEILTRIEALEKLNEEW